MSITTTQFAGHEAIQIESGGIRLMVTTGVGPRVLGLLTEDGANHFAELPESTLECPGSGPFHLRGGSRLWAAPEDPRFTYRPDDDPVGVEEIADRAHIFARQLGDHPPVNLSGHMHIIHRPVSGAGADPERMCNRREVVLAKMKQPAGEQQCTQPGGGKQGIMGSGQLAADKKLHSQKFGVKTGIVGDNHGTMQHFAQGRGDLAESGLTEQIIITDAIDGARFGVHLPVRLQQRVDAADFTAVLQPQRRDFHNPVYQSGCQAGCLRIQDHSGNLCRQHL